MLNDQPPPPARPKWGGSPLAQFWTSPLRVRVPARTTYFLHSGGPPEYFWPFFSPKLFYLLFFSLLTILNCIVSCIFHKKKLVKTSKHFGFNCLKLGWPPNIFFFSWFHFFVLTSFAKNKNCFTPKKIGFKVFHQYETTSCHLIKFWCFLHFFGHPDFQAAPRLMKECVFDVQIQAVRTSLFWLFIGQAVVKLSSWPIKRPMLIFGH